MTVKLLWISSILLVGAVVLLASGCVQTADTAPIMPGGDAARGRVLLHTYGCGACHLIPGVRRANSLVGPPLTAWAERHYIAGSLPNRAENLRQWLQDPQAVEPGTAMPDMGVTEQDARDMGAYLYTLTGN
jgi:cytochrome c